MAHSVWTGGSRYTGQAALPHKNIQAPLLAFTAELGSFCDGLASARRGATVGPTATSSIFPFSIGIASVMEKVLNVIGRNSPVKPVPYTKKRSNFRYPSTHFTQFCLHSDRFYLSGTTLHSCNFCDLKFQTTF